MINDPAIETALTAARERYVAANMATLNWLLERPALHGAFLNTKVHSITLEDYQPGQDLRGPEYLYGWIQGRGLEALVSHAAWLENQTDTQAREIAARLFARARTHYGAMAELYSRHGGGYFLYDADLTPVFADGGRAVRAQRTQSGYRTYSDLFVLKGLIVAASRFQDDRLDDWLAEFTDVVAAIREDRFIIDEKQLLDRSAAQRATPNYGPLMIALGAATVLQKLDRHGAAAYGAAFAEAILATFRDPSTHLLRDDPDGDYCNPGHSIEFAAFALDYFSRAQPGRRNEDILGVLDASLRAGFAGPGISIGVSVRTGELISPHFPWWVMPEAIRACAFAFRETSDRKYVQDLTRADGAFFANYWRGEPPIAYQNRTLTTPTDVTPSTPDLDPGYHTGLSLLETVQTIDRLIQGATSPASITSDAPMMDKGK